MTARERREREVQKMANRLDRMLAPYAQRHEIASVVLRLLAAERRKAAARASRALVRTGATVEMVKAVYAAAAEDK